MKSGCFTTDTVSWWCEQYLVKPAKSLRYGFNGMERDDEMRGSGNSYDFGARIYDPRVGRWFSVDPSESKYPYVSPYNYTLNNPIYFIDPDGKDPREGNKVLNVDMESSFIIDIPDKKPGFGTMDRPLSKKALDEFTYHSAIGPRVKLYKAPELAREIWSAMGTGKRLGELISGQKISNLRYAWVVAADSKKGYSYVEINEEDQEMIVRKVSNLGEGYENMVTNKEVYNKKGELVSQEMWWLSEKEVDGKQVNYLNKLTITSREKGGGFDMNIDREYEEAKPNLKESNEKND